MLRVCLALVIVAIVSANAAELPAVPILITDTHLVTPIDACGTVSSTSYDTGASGHLAGLTVSNGFLFYNDGVGQLLKKDLSSTSSSAEQVCGECLPRIDGGGSVADFVVSETHSKVVAWTENKFKTNTFGGNQSTVIEEYEGQAPIVDAIMVVDDLFWVEDNTATDNNGRILRATVTGLASPSAILSDLDHPLYITTGPGSSHDVYYNDLDDNIWYFTKSQMQAGNVVPTFGWALRPGAHMVMRELVLSPDTGNLYVHVYDLDQGSSSDPGFSGVLVANATTNSGCLKTVVDNPAKIETTGTHLAIVSSVDRVCGSLECNPNYQGSPSNSSPANGLVASPLLVLLAALLASLALL